MVVNFFLMMQSSGNFAWGVLGKDDGLAIRRVTKKFGSTHLMPTIVAACHEFLLKIAKIGRFPRIEVWGYDPKRAKLYQAWAKLWNLPGYRGIERPAGVEFIKDERRSSP
jgi:hypothetical protein